MKKTVLLTLSLFVQILLVSCNRSIIDTDPTDSSEYQTVEMSLTTSFQGAMQQQTDDTEVAELDLVVCKDGYYQYSRPAYASEYAKFRSTLKIDQQVDIYFFANCRAALTPDILVEGTPWEDIRARLVIVSPGTPAGGRTLLPMWGRAKGVTIADNKINKLSVRLLRAVASANVVFDLTPGQGYSFVPDIAYVYYGADRAFLAPTEENLTFEAGELSGVSVPVSPSGMRTDRKYAAAAVSGAFVNSLYMFDNETDASDFQNSGNRRTRLVVGGYLNGSQELTYYPLDFAHSATGEILRVTRNCRYNIRITSVNSQGWTDPDEAAGQASVNLNYEVIPWNENDHDHIAVDGPDYLSVSSKSLTLYRKAGSKATIRLTGTFLRERISLEFSPVSPNGVPIQQGDILQNDRFSVEISGSGTNHTLTVTALGDYSATSAEQNTDSFVIRAGRIRFDVAIEQIYSGGWDDGGEEEIDF